MIGRWSNANIFFNTNYTSARLMPDLGDRRVSCPAGWFLWNTGAIMADVLLRTVRSLWRHIICTTALLLLARIIFLFPFVGTASSCLKMFNPIPYMFCNIEGTCRYASNDGKSYWLSTSLDKTNMDITGVDVSLYFSYYWNEPSY